MSIVVDTSALVAILLREADAARFADVFESQPDAEMSAASYVELLLVMRKRLGAPGEALAQELIQAAGIAITPVTEDQTRFAAEASGRYGTLNYGDLFAYALAQAKKRPLLFKGDDFSQTDVRSALPEGGGA